MRVYSIEIATARLLLSRYPSPLPDIRVLRLTTQFIFLSFCLCFFPQARVLDDNLGSIIRLESAVASGAKTPTAFKEQLIAKGKLQVLHNLEGM